MQNKDLIIVALILVAIYLYYQQNKLNIQPIENTELRELQNQVNHYQKLYQQRVEKDLSGESKIKELNQDWENRYTELESLNNQQATEANSREKELQQINQSYSKKITDLETSLLNLAKQKIKGKKEASELLTKLETNWQNDTEIWQKEKEQLQKANEKFNQFLLAKDQKLNEVQQEIKQLQQQKQDLFKQLQELEFTDQEKQFLKEVDKLWKLGSSLNFDNLPQPLWNEVKNAWVDLKQSKLRNVAGLLYYRMNDLEKLWREQNKSWWSK